jgi:prepilin-type N-terminal cleavage/methylation domain-containing protein
MFTNPRHIQGRAGFTLFEVMASLTILTFLMVTVFGIIQGTLQLAAGIEESRRRDQQLDGFIELCRRSFRIMPAQAVWEGRLRRQEEKAYAEIIIRRAPEIFAWDKLEDFDAVSVLGVRPQVGGLFSLGLLRSSQPDGLQVDPVLNSKPEDWLILVSDLARVEWRYYDPRTRLWLDELPAGGLRPSAVELKYWLPGEENPEVAVFWVVPMVAQVTVPSAQQRRQEGSPEQTPQPEGQGSP